MMASDKEAAVISMKEIFEMCAVHAELGFGEGIKLPSSIFKVVTTAK